jgi:site-specific recombinase XerD
MKRHYRFKLRTDRKGQNNAYPVVMVITKNRKRQFITVKKVFALPEYWDDEKESIIIIEGASTKAEREENKTRKEYNTVIEDYRKRAEEIEFEYMRENNSHWTLNQFKEKFNSQATQGKIEPFLKELIQTLKETHHYSTSINYNKLYNKLGLFDIDFTNRRFKEIDYSYVNNFNMWMEKMSTSNNTRAFYLIRLCAVYNRAIKAEQANKDDYPFGWNGFSISTLFTETSKRYLPTEYLEKLKNKKSDNPQNEYARNVFLLSYYLYGMSFKDMAVLTKDNIFKHNDGDYIVYKRLKTKEKKAQPISIKITDTIREIIDFLTNYKKPIDNYLLPIISKRKDTPTALAKHTSGLLILHNTYLRRLAKELEINMDLTSYVARHTMAMQLQEKKIPEHIISQMLGHKKLETTKVYLDSLDTSVVDEAAKVL